MNEYSKHRVMWLLNHTTLRKFELEQMKSLGITEFFLPKRFPYDEANLSANVTYSEDVNLSISQEELAILNAQDWYESPSREAWDIANSYFSIIFIGFFPRQIESATRNFGGGIILRVFGLDSSNYSALIRQLGGEVLEAAIRRCGMRFWFGIGYEHLANGEYKYLSDRSVFLPVGLNMSKVSAEWLGDARHILFVCPRISTSPYYNSIYKEFIKNFKGLDYRIGGKQPIKVNDPKVLGFVSREQYDYNFQQSRVMFYHSQTPNHIHYHPFEAIQAGMPLVFMAEGMLDRLGGRHLLGRCKTWREAKEKIKRILNDDWKLIRQIRNSQIKLLEVMRLDICFPIWASGFDRILTDLSSFKSAQQVRPQFLRARQKRIAVILPVEYRGGSLRGAIQVANALYLGSRQSQEPIEVVFLHVDRPDMYADEEFSDLINGVERRTFSWQHLTEQEARRAMILAGFENWKPLHDSYVVPDDGISQCQNYDLWFVISDRIEKPLLPIRPFALMVYDYLQRYVNFPPSGFENTFLQIARSAVRVFVTTDFTASDALQYAGVSKHKILKMPMLSPLFHVQNSETKRNNSQYFIWTTNLSLHKNHENTIKALRVYYEDLYGDLDCLVTGVEVSRIKKMLTKEEDILSHLSSLCDIIEQSDLLKKKVVFCGDLPDLEYRKLLEKASFVWHTALVDNGTFCVVEAASLGVPSLSSDYPAMREIDQQFKLNLAWMNPNCYKDMAEQLKLIEENSLSRTSLLPSIDSLKNNSIEALAHYYWEGVRECL